MNLFLHCVGSLEVSAFCAPVTSFPAHTATCTAEEDPEEVIKRASLAVHTILARSNSVQARSPTSNNAAPEATASQVVCVLLYLSKLLGIEAMSSAVATTVRSKYGALAGIVRAGYAATAGAWWL